MLRCHGHQPYLTLAKMGSTIATQTACALGITMMIVSHGALADAPRPNVSTAFFYGPHPPPSLFAHFDRVVVEPDYFDQAPSSPRAMPIAYVSVGEVNRSRAWRKDIPAGLIAGANPAWGTDIMDTRKPEWRAFLVDKVFEPLWQKGFRGFFFDTMDSYERVTSDPAQRAEYAEGLALITRSLRDRHPDARVIFNRGFDVLPKLQSLRIDALVAESLFRTADASGLQYDAVDPQSSSALLARLNEAHTKYGLPINIIDYVPATMPDARRETAKKILAAGFEPWVTVPQLDEVGIGSVEIVPRRIAVLYKSTPTVALALHDSVTLVGPILEYYGYAIDYIDVRGALPADDLVNQVAGIVAFLPEGVDDEPTYERWIKLQMSRGIRVAFIEGFGFEPDPAFLARLGVKTAPLVATAPMTIATSTPYFGFEAPLRVRLRERRPVTVASSTTQSLLHLTDGAGNAWDGAMLGSWGGAVFSPYMIEEGLEQSRRWILDPYRFLKDALALPAIPAPDVTTESGRRILTVHIDGDAFVSRAERRGNPFCGQVILDEVLKKYPIPHTVSIIEGEVGPKGLYPRDSPKLEAIARQIFALPNVEIGTHLYSHPFDWQLAEAGLRGPPLPFLPIPNYSYDLTREMSGSTDYINTLAPPGKRVKVVQWTGDCLPSATAVKAAGDLGLLNVNGGGATRTQDTPSMTRASALGIPQGSAYQVFAPVENENVYTNDWRGPFYGFRQVIDTFTLNESPRRLSTITLYYHFYSAAKTAALEALFQVYDWAMKQETTPLYLSEYARKVLSFRSATLARRLDGAWELGNMGDVHTVRLDASLGWPDMSASRNVAGVRDQSNGRWVHVTGDSALLALSPNAPTRPFILQANGTPVSFTPNDHGASLRVSGHVPITLVIGGVTGATGCKLVTTNGTVLGVRAGTTVTFKSTVTDTGEATLDCR